MRAIICRLLTKLFVDQEPRRPQIYPELCKIVHKSEKANKGEIFEIDSISEKTRREKINLDDIKNNIVDFIKKISEDVSELSENI